MLNKKLVLAVNEAKLVKNNKKKLNAERYYCPRCKKRIILVISQSKNAFFKHLSSSIEVMGEKEEHHSAKLLLKTALTAAGFSAQTEVPLAAGQLRADVLASPSLAFEVQCAPLSENEFNHRHQLYKKEKIIDVWVVGHRHFLRKKIKKTQIIFFRRNHLWHDYYLEIDPQNNFLRLKYNILLAPITNEVYFQQEKFILDEIGLQRFWHFCPVLKNYAVNSLEQKKYLQLQLTQKSIMGLRIAQELYEQHQTLENLPDKVFSTLRPINSQDNVTSYLKSSASREKG
ncbi:competence protein CoiA family protein [Lactobacillus sp. ESL0791]|uniref:competence protein CoiA family protein n=1 Tax=Lactobacillus sp. ESL0791 TaxID=2983234 RepID=UPI0023F95A14|nr:competence protein CoiA family protein [Lactobacillus sp. ESL0791]MDF7638547.1 competence protein CoiA family protein [Lactobacillus sp. ESL0791]